MQSRHTNIATVGALACVLLSTACGPLSPEAQEASKYVRLLQPLMVENGHLAERVLLLSADVYNSKGDTDTRAESWSNEVVPLSEHLHNQTQFADAPASWSQPHAELVDIWGDRAGLYRNLSEALVVADLESWKKSRNEATDVKLREEKWFKSVNQALSKHGLSIDPSP